MPKKPAKKSHLTIVRDALGLSQGEFADRLGESTSTIKKVEEGTRPGSTHLKARIYSETGLVFFNKDEPGHRPNDSFAYTKAQHEAWMKEVQFNEHEARAAARVILKQIELMLIAAARPSVNKSFQVFTELLMAVDMVKDQFHMDKHLEAEMRDRHMTETRRFTVRELRADAALAKLWNFQDAAKRRPDETVLLEKSRGWFPAKEIGYILSQHRDLNAEILAAQDGQLSDDAKAKLESSSQRIEKDIERAMTGFIPPGSLIKKSVPS